jgi:hypothetical protein
VKAATEIFGDPVVAALWVSHNGHSEGEFFADAVGTRDQDGFVSEKEEGTTCRRKENSQEKLSVRAKQVQSVRVSERGVR